ncbi:MAG: leucine-rich repeat protein [Bacilli bacterium]|jgi:hypothetical protein
MAKVIQPLSIKQVGESYFDLSTQRLYAKNMVTSIVNLFMNSGSLNKIYAPLLTEVPTNAFRNCGALSCTSSNNTIYLPKATIIHEFAFRQSNAIVYLDLPSCTQIDAQAFGTGLTTLILRKNQVATLSNVNAFDVCPIATSPTTGFVYVPDNLVDSYKAATNWITYASKIKGITELP